MNESGSSLQNLDLHRRGDAYLATSYSLENRLLRGVPWPMQVNNAMHFPHGARWSSTDRRAP